MAAPFPNNYHLRLVAQSDARACAVCYKPTTTVLVNDNKLDHFYICASHTNDAQFAAPVHPPEYVEFLEQQKTLKEKVAQLEQDVERLKPYMWNRVVNNIPGWSKAEAPKESKDVDPANAKSNDEKHKLYRAQLGENSLSLAEVDAKIAGFKFKSYVLNKDIYKIRINNYLQAKVRQRRQQELHSPGFFPSVPTAGVGAPPSRDEDNTSVDDPN